MSQEIRTQNQTQGKPFDLEKALNNMDEDRELFQILVAVFVEESAGHMEEIREGIQRTDAGAVERAAHTLKGTAGNFAAQRTIELASHLEVLGRERRFRELPKAFAQLEEELDLLREALRSAAG